MKNLTILLMIADEHVDFDLLTYCAIVLSNSGSNLLMLVCFIIIILTSLSINLYNRAIWNCMRRKLVISLPSSVSISREEG